MDLGSQITAEMLDLQFYKPSFSLHYESQSPAPQLLGGLQTGLNSLKPALQNLVLLKQELESINDTIRSQAEQSTFVQRNKSVGLQSMLPDDAVAKTHTGSNQETEQVFEGVSLKKFKTDIKHILPRKH